MPFPGNRLPHISCSTALPLAASPASLSTRTQNPRPAAALGSGARRTWQHHIYRESQEDLTEKDLQQWLNEWQQQEPVQSAALQPASTSTSAVRQLYNLVCLLHGSAACSGNMLLHLQAPASPEAEVTGRAGRPGQLVQGRRILRQASCGATAGQAAGPPPAASGTTGTQVRPRYATGQCTFCQR